MVRREMTKLESEKVRGLRPAIIGVSFFAILFLSFVNLYAQDFKIRSFLDKAVIGLNQQFELQIELSGSNANGAPQPAPPDVTTFARYLGSQTSTNMQFVNGKMSVNVTYTYHYLATAEGKYQIPPVKYDFKGESYSTDAIAVEIIKQQHSPARPLQSRQPGQDSRASQQQNLDEQLFLRATIDKEQVFQNEAVIVSYKLYFAVNVNNYGISELPNTVGFWSEEFELPSTPKVYNETVNGRQFRVAEIKKVALFSQGPGEKKLDPLVVECEVQMPRKRGRRSQFDSFFDDPFFGFAQTVRKTLASNELTLKVLPLPEKGKPRDFSGAVGNFAISASTDKQRTKTNEAITLKVRLSGSGNMKILPQPRIDFPADFEVYDPKIVENFKRADNQVSGSKTFEYVLIPRFPGRQTINPIRFTYFDVAGKRYKTVTTSPLDIVVEKGEQQFVATGMASSKEDVKFIGQDIRFIQMHLPEFSRIGNAFYKSRVFFLLIGLPLLALAGAHFQQRQQQRLSSNVAYARSRKANQMAVKRLKKARKELDSGNAKSFYSEVSTALMGFIGDKLNVSAAGLIVDEVAQMLRQRGIGDEVVNAYLDCLKTCDFQRFAPNRSSNGDMKTLFDQARHAIITLERHI